MYIREVDGLVLLQEARALRIPNVLAVSERLLVLEWIEMSQPTHGFDEAFGRGLAALHCASLPTFGLAQDNFLGPFPQINLPLPTWHAFYAERRIRPFAFLAYAHKLIDTALLTRIEALCERLDQLCGPSDCASAW
jgi:fructosamine-3-kinase